MTNHFIQMYKMSRARLNNQFINIKSPDLRKRLHSNSNSIGFLLQHIAEVEQLFAKNIFGLDIEVRIQTVGLNIHDSGKFIMLNELITFLLKAETEMEQAILKQSNEDWANAVTAAEFGTISNAEALARIISHTSYHAGQIAITLKYGT